MAVTFVGERDVELLQAIEAAVGVKMTAYEGIVDDEVLTSMNKINMARRTANLKLLESSFVERQQERKQRSRASRGLPDPAAAKAAVVAGKEKRSRAAKKSRATHRE